MSARGNGRALRRIVRIRDAQRQAAELHAARSSRDLRAARERCREEAARMEERAHAWLAAVNGTSLSLELSGSWASAVAAGEEELRARQADATAAEAERARRNTEWRAAIARADVAEALAGAADRDARARRDENRLNALADRAALAGYPS